MTSHPRLRSYGAPATALALLLVLGLRPAAAVEVTACGQVVPQGTVGILVADLACGAHGVVLANRATLLLNGFTVTGTSGGTNSCAGNCAGVQCQGRSCRVSGPGEIRGFHFGVEAQSLSSEGGARARIDTVRLAENTAGFWGDSVRLEDAEVADSSLIGVVAGQKARVKNTLFVDNVEGGLSSSNLRAVSVTVVGGGPNGLPGIHGNRVRLSDVTVTGGQSGGASGAHSLSAVDCTLTGNAPYDVQTIGRPPRLVRTSCLVSSDGYGGDWDVCAAD